MPTRLITGGEGYCNETTQISQRMIRTTAYAGKTDGFHSARSTSTLLRAGDTG